MRRFSRLDARADDRCAWCQKSVGRPFVACSSATMSQLRAILDAGRCEEPCKTVVPARLGSSNDGEQERPYAESA